MTARFSGLADTMSVLLRGSTAMALAYAAFQEEVKGTLEVGKYADVVVLTKDVMTIDPLEILSTEVEMTVLCGKVVYTRVSAQQAQ